MSRNKTYITVFNPSDKWDTEEIFYRVCDTMEKARRACAANPGTSIRRDHYTPSSHRFLRDKSTRRTRGLLRLQRLYRKMKRREADKRKREEKIKREEAVERVADVMERFGNLLRGERT